MSAAQLQLAEKASLSQTIAAFRDAMRGQGIETKSHIEADGKLHRFHVDGDAKGSLNGFYCLHFDEKPAGVFGCNKRYGFDKKFQWQSNQKTQEWTPEERAAYKARVAKERAEKDATEKARHEAAAAAANELWNASAEASDDHPYLKSKGVKAHGLRVGKWEKVNKETGEVRLISDNALLVPICDRTRKIHSLQAIFPAKMKAMGDRNKDYMADGAKRGLFHRIGNPQLHDGKHVFILCEGYATGASIHECTGHTALVCFDAGNLPVVAQAIHEFMKSNGKDAIIVLAADNDRWTSKPVANPGVFHARDAVKFVGGLLAVPDFEDLDGKPTDFNDLHQREGADAVADIIADAIANGRTEVADNVVSVLLPEAAVPPAKANDNNDPETGRDEERRRQQQDENERIQETQFGVMFPAKMELDEMLKELVWIAEGEQVAHVSENRTMFLSFKEFRSLTAESTTFKPDEGMRRPVPNSVLWQRDTLRLNAMTRTFRAGAGVICADPDGKMAVNTWRPMRRWEARADISLFLDHVAYLIADEVEREKFLDWLAHLEQKPGELPHYGWLHVAKHTGCGRNWLASVLARVWRGYVAPNVDLPALLDSSYNGCLAGRVMAIVDEIQEGGGENSYRHTNRLRSMLNSEYRDINPKFGRQYREHNSTRWLVFSNHLNALPIDNTDRRWRIVVHNDAPRSPEVYEKLYAALNDNEFINAVAAFLKSRDISEFKPGERPPMNAAKLAVVGASKSSTQQFASELVEHWPSDVVINDDVVAVLSDAQESKLTNHMTRSLEELGAVKGSGPLKVNGKAHRYWILRNVSKWEAEGNQALVNEINRARQGHKHYEDARFVMTGSRDGASGTGSLSLADDDYPI